MNQKEMFTQIKNALNGENVEVTVEDMVAFIDKKIEQVSRKSTKPVSEEDASLRKETLTFIKEHGDVSVAEVRQAMNITSQKAIGVLKALIKTGDVEVENKVYRAI